MPFRLAIARDKNLIYLIAEGFVTDRELYGCVRAALESPDFQKGMNVCLVADEEAELALRPGMIKRRLAPLIGRYRRTAEHYRLACVVFTEEHERAFEELLESLPKRATARFFHGPKAALSWLGHPLPGRLHMRLLGEARLCDELPGSSRKLGDGAGSLIH